MKKNWRKITAALAMVVILIAVNACNFPGIDSLFLNPKVKIVTITEVSVTPESGSGDFTLSFTYTRERTGAVTISCSYVSPDKNTYGIISVEDANSMVAGSVTKTKNFAVVKTEDTAVPGVYTATCEDEYGLSMGTDIFTVGDDANADVSILDVKVAEGAKYHYALEMMYVIRIPNDVPFTCNYVAPSGGTFLIGNYTDTQHLDEPTTTSMYFSLTPREGTVEPGLYVATCKDDDLRTSKSTNFVVTEESTPTPTLTPTPRPSTLMGRITFTFGQMISDSTNGFGDITIIQGACVPDVVISSTGEITGICGYSGTVMGLLSEMDVDANVTGPVVQSGAMEFTYTVIAQGSNGWDLQPGETAADAQVWNNIAVWQVTFTGTGVFTNQTSASGNANISYSCDSGASNLYWCSSLNKMTYTGTVPWTFSAVP
jgi:hypothetical protein